MNLHVKSGHTSELPCMQTFDIESGCDTELLNLNPEGWIASVSNERNWGMLYGMDVSWHRNMILAGDSHGFVHAVDSRANQPLLGKHQLHKKGNKASTCMWKGGGGNSEGHPQWV